MDRHDVFISSGLWFDDHVSQAVRFYESAFPDVQVLAQATYGKAGFEVHGRPEGSVMFINFQLFESRFQAINGGPAFRMNPSISFFVMCDDAAEADRYWQVLSKDAKVLMPIDRYAWSERYGWLQDQYGVSWQIHTGSRKEGQQKICPSLMFVGEQHGRAEEAIHFYTSVFRDSAVGDISRYPAGGMDPEDTVMHAQFELAGQFFVAMDSAMEHAFQFNEGISLIVNCETQAAIDYYWEKLSEDGEESECGWLKDRFGVSWQIVPVQLDQMLATADAAKRERVVEAFMRMKKFDLAALEKAFEG